MERRCCYLNCCTFQLTDILHKSRQSTRFPLLYLSHFWGRFSSGQGRVWEFGSVQFLSTTGGRVPWSFLLIAFFLFPKEVLAIVPCEPFSLKNCATSCCICLCSLLHLSSLKRLRGISFCTKSGQSFFSFFKVSIDAKMFVKSWTWTEESARCEFIIIRTSKCAWLCHCLTLTIFYWYLTVLSSQLDKSNVSASSLRKQSNANENTIIAKVCRIWCLFISLL